MTSAEIALIRWQLDSTPWWRWLRRRRLRRRLEYLASEPRSLWR